MSQAPNTTVEKPRKKRKKRPPHKSKMITGYIIYASEIRKDVIKKYPDRDFGDISKLVGIEWKNLPQETKVAYEKRAQEQNAKSKAITAEAFELKKLADAAEERAREQQQPSQQQRKADSTTVQYCNNNINNNNNNNNTNTNTNNNNATMNASSPAPAQQIQLQINHLPSPTTVTHNQTPQQAQYQKNNIIYRTPATVRQKPKDATTQSEPIRWVKKEPKEPTKFSQKFIDYLAEHKSVIMAKLSAAGDTSANCC